MSTTFWLAAMLAALMVLTGCARMFTAQTTVHVEKTADGACTADYSSSKEQEGLEASMCGGDIKTVKSGTLESAVAAALQMQLTMARLLEQLLAKTPVPLK